MLVPTLRQPTAPTVDRFWRVIGERLDAFTPDECPNHFAVAGYHAYRSEMLQVKRQKYCRMNMASLSIYGVVYSVLIE